MYPFQGNQPNGQQHAQPPPLKKHKTSSGAVVTYYPPPPGYVPPPNAQIPQAAWQAGQYQQSAWTPQQQAYYQQYYQQYAQAAGGYPSYPQANGWQHSQGYQHGYHQGQPQGQSMSQYSAQGYPAYGASNYSGYQNYQAPNQQQGNQWPTQPPQSGPSAGSPQQSTPDVSQGFAKPIAPASATYASQDRTSRAVSIATSNAGDSVAADDEYKPVHEFDETDYCREASYVKDGDSIPQNLSLGTIGKAFQSHSLGFTNVPQSIVLQGQPKQPCRQHTRKLSWTYWLPRCEKAKTSLSPNTLSRQDLTPSI